MQIERHCLFAHTTRTPDEESRARCCPSFSAGTAALGITQQYSTAKCLP